MIRRVVMLLAVSVMLFIACTPPQPDRPREGAPVGPGGQPVQRDEANSAPPTLSPYVTPTSTASLRPPEQQPGIASEVGSPSPVASPSPPAAGGYVITATDGRGANLRTGPSTSSPVITTVAEGTAVEVLGDPVTVDGRAWRQIRAGGRDGWVVAVVVRQGSPVAPPLPQPAPSPAAPSPTRSA